MEQKFTEFSEFRFLTQEVAGSSPFTIMTNIFVTEFSENI